MRRNNIVYRIIFKTAGMLFSIVPVTIAILSYFPIWIGGGKLSGELERISSFHLTEFWISSLILSEARTLEIKK